VAQVAHRPGDRRDTHAEPLGEVGGGERILVGGHDRREHGQVPRLLEASLAQVPAVWVLGGLAFALAGLLPRLVAVAWAVFAASFMLGELGEAFKLPDWVLDLSPFRHAPQFPAVDLRVAPLLALVAATTVLALGGMVGLRRRDIA